MKKQLTRSELEAIGQNWLNRRNKLLDRSQDELLPALYRTRAIILAYIMNRRITKIAIILGQTKPRKDFPPGGFKQVDSIKNLKPGEYVIAKPNFRK